MSQWIAYTPSNSKTHVVFLIYTNALCSFLSLSLYFHLSLRKPAARIHTLFFSFAFLLTFYGSLARESHYVFFSLIENINERFFTISSSTLSSL
jgi:hypothetical protein